MKIIGRQEEQRELKRLFHADTPEFAIVYGRRRVGKTFLVRETLGHAFTFYATGVARGSKDDQLSAFYSALLEYGLPMKYARPVSWEEAFELLKEVIERSTQKRKVVFIDEMPWLDTAKSKFLTSLDLFWNKWASAREDILLVCCGSAASWMVKNIVQSRGGLHNRITCKIKLSPFTLAETRSFLLFSATKLTDGGTFGTKLEELEQCGFIRKYKAVGSKALLYQLIDFYTLFYYKFIYGQKDGDSSRWMHLMLSRTYSTWCGLAFERLCMSEADVIKTVLGIKRISRSC